MALSVYERVRGRGVEVAVLEAALDCVAAGAAAVVFEGEAGIGKTAVWSAGVASARARLLWVLAARPAEAEARLAYASLTDLLESILDETLPQLPDPQRRALETALLRRDNPGGDPGGRAVAAATLAVLRALAAVAPVVLAVDDLQWLDRPSAGALAFALRRLQDEPVLLLATRRSRTPAALEPHDLFPHERVRRMEIGPLAPQDVRRLVAGELDHDLPPAVLKRVVRTAGGNPLFALELGRALQDREISDRVAEPLPLPSRLGELVLDRLAALPADVRRVLVEAAALAQPTVDIVVAASDARRRALAKASELEVVELRDGHVRFSHPLFASALYDRLSSREREALHRRLASRLEDPEERARHLTLAGHDADEDVAAAIEAGAELAATRGAPDEAGELLERAAALTLASARDQRDRRTRRAAQLAIVGGDPVRARALLETLVAEMEPGPARAEALIVLANAVSNSQDLRAPGALLEQALTEAGDDVPVRAAAERRLANFSIHAGDLRSAASHARSAVALTAGVDPTDRAQALALEAHIAFMVGDGYRRSSFEQALALHAGSGNGPEWHPALLAAPTFIAAGELEKARAMLEELRTLLEEWGVESRLSYVLATLAHIDIELGYYERAAVIADEAIAVARQAHQPGQATMGLVNRGRAEVFRGDFAGALRSIEEGRTIAETAGTNVTGGAGVFAETLAFMELSRGDPARACEHLAPLHDHYVAQGFVAASYFRFLGDEIEALIATGALGKARERLEGWEERGRILPAPLPLALAGRCRALLEAASGQADAALVSAALALEHHERIPNPFERARTLLVKGALERRLNRRRAARATLEDALAFFERVGAPLWAAKAKHGLGRIGGRRAAARSATLTQSEERVAELVTAGRTNREVADALFVSVKTVEANLSRIYRKLDVRSRTELAAALRAVPRQTDVEQSKR